MLFYIDYFIQFLYLKTNAIDLPKKKKQTENHWLFLYFFSIVFFLCCCL